MTEDQISYYWSILVMLASYYAGISALFFTQKLIDMNSKYYEKWHPSRAYIFKQPHMWYLAKFIGVILLAIAISLTIELLTGYVLIPIGRQITL